MPVQIILLRDLGFGVSEIALALDRWDDDYIAAQLDAKRLDIESTIKNEQDKLARIELAKRDIQREKIAVNYSVSIKDIPSYDVFSLRRVVPDYYAEGLLWKEMSAFADEHDIPISENTFTIYHDADYKETDVDIEICALVPKMGESIGGFTYRRTEPVPIMACTMVHGHFENIMGAFLNFANWIQEHNQYRMCDHSRQIVHRGPWNEPNIDQYLKLYVEYGLLSQEEVDKRK